MEKATEVGRPAIFCGLDRMLQGAPVLDREELDRGDSRTYPCFVVMDDSGHEVYFNSGVIKVLGWADGTPPADPPASRYGRKSDGSSNGRAFETGAVASVLMPERGWSCSVPWPHSVAQWYSALAGYEFDGKLGPCLRQRVVADLRGVGRHRRLPGKGVALMRWRPLHPALTP